MARAKPRKARQRIVVGALRLAVAEEDALARQRHPDAPTPFGIGPSAPSGSGARIGIGGIGPGHRGQRRHGVVDRERKHRHAIERAAGRHDAAVETSPRLGLRPTMLLSAAGTRPEPAVSVPSASGTRPAATATAEPELDPPGMSVGIERIARHAIRRAHADQPGRELIEIGLADDDGAGCAQARHRRSRLRAG